MRLKFSEILKQVDRGTSALQWQDSFSWEELVGGNEKSKELSFFPFCFDFASQPTKYFATDIIFHSKAVHLSTDSKLSCRRWGDALTAEFTTIQTYSPENIERLAVSDIVSQCH